MYVPPQAKAVWLPEMSSALKALGNGSTPPYYGVWEVEMLSRWTFKTSSYTLIGKPLKRLGTALKRVIGVDKASLISTNNCRMHEASHTSAKAESSFLVSLSDCGRVFS
jgi:hypothetical protein